MTRIDRDGRRLPSRAPALIRAGTFVCITTASFALGALWGLDRSPAMTCLRDAQELRQDSAGNAQHAVIMEAVGYAALARADEVVTKLCGGSFEQAARIGEYAPVMMTSGGDRGR